MTRSIETEVAIDAPPETVWRVLMAVEAFPEWNDVVRFVRRPHAGETQPMSVKLFGMWLRVPIHFEAVDEGCELRWRGGPPGVFVGTHFFRIVERDDGGTTVRHGETFHGAAVPLLFPLLRSGLLCFYQRINEGLHGHAEALGPFPSSAG